jgi:predicted enzyme related to lactoylglutathione lyase
MTSLAHFTLATRHVEATAAFFEAAFAFTRTPTPANSPIQIVWLNIGLGQEIHVIHVPDFDPSEFEQEFGRHVAFVHDGGDMDALEAKVVAHGGVIVPPRRTTPFRRFFFREPVNGYLFEVIDEKRDPV